MYPSKRLEGSRNYEVLSRYTSLVVSSHLLFVPPLFSLLIPIHFPPSSPFDQNMQENAKKKKRVVSLDVFRGMCITIMIFVNYGGGINNRDTARTE